MAVRERAQFGRNHFELYRGELKCASGLCACGKAQAP